MIAWLDVSEGVHGRARLAHAADAVMRAAADLALRGLALAAAWQSRRRGRRELLRLDDRLLRDIGVTRYEPLVGARKPFWRD